MGTAHIQISDVLLEQLQKPPLNQLVTIITWSDFGDGSISAFVASDALPEGFNGVQEIIVDRVTPSVKFRKEADT